MPYATPSGIPAQDARQADERRHVAEDHDHVETRVVEGRLQGQRGRHLGEDGHRKEDPGRHPPPPARAARARRAARRTARPGPAGRSRCCRRTSSRRRRSGQVQAHSIRTGRSFGTSIHVRRRAPDHRSIRRSRNLGSLSMTRSAVVRDREGPAEVGGQALPRGRTRHAGRQEPFQLALAPVDHSIDGAVISFFVGGGT